MPAPALLHKLAFADHGLYDDWCLASAIELIHGRLG